MPALTHAPTPVSTGTPHLVLCRMLLFFTAERAADCGIWLFCLIAFVQCAFVCVVLKFYIYCIIYDDFLIVWNAQCKPSRKCQFFGHIHAERLQTHKICFLQYLVRIIFVLEWLQWLILFGPCCSWSWSNLLFTILIILILMLSSVFDHVQDHWHARETGTCIYIFEMLKLIWFQIWH